MFKENKEKITTILKTSEDESSLNLNGFQRLREFGFIFGVLISLFLAIALYSFDPADPSWSQTSWGGEVKNAGGTFGAWLADTLFFTFGILAFILPAVIAIIGYGLFRNRTENDPLDLMLWGTRLLGLSIMVLTSCGLADINFDDIWYFSSGGIVGDVLTSFTLPTLSVLGTTLVLLFLWGASLTLLTGISWLSIVEWLGSMAISFVTGVLNRVRGNKTEKLQANTDAASYTDDESDSEFHFEKKIVETPEKKPEPASRYNIHIPPSAAEAEPQQMDEQVDEVRGEELIEEMDPGIKLHSTIEELESVATHHHDASHHETVEHRVIEPVTQGSSEPLIESEPEELQQPAFSMEALDEIYQEEQQTGASEPEVTNLDAIVETTMAEEELPEVEDMAQAEQAAHSDPDVEAFQNIVQEAQKNMAAQENPFLMKKEESLPVPTSPMPTLELLYHPEKRENHIDRAALEEIARLVESKLADYKITAQVVGIFPGPVITRFELDLAPGVKVSRISSLSMDLARSLSAMAVRVVEVIPGKPYVGLELPNMSRQTVFFSDVVGSKQFQEATSPTTVVMGQDIAGEAVIADIAKMPHVLVAGTTGSGKSVGVNVMILSMLYKAKPEDLRFIMIDPKMLELSIYEGIPHLLAEVVTDMKDASNALRWCVGEMERRYKLMSALGVRNVKGFNDKLKMAADAGHPIHDPLWQPGDSMDQEPPLLEKLPYIVVVVDEFADLMMVVGKKVEELIARLAQKARAAGIHLILATQRPSVDVITGLIKANIPTRVAFTVSTKTDSRTILDQGGAESLLGMGDMLYLPPGSSHTIRVHGAFASDDDVHAVVNDWKARGKPQYIDEITNGEQSPEMLLPGETMESDEDVDPLFDQVVEHVVETRRGSVSGVQRRFKIGYNRAARIVEQLEAQGIVSAPGHNGNREVLAPAPLKD
ncbi:DNA translocase FtsK 4TM domain-containing protein [Vibrio hannami]|uniref:DNA translocase FtsK n=1 Tax=Vibrio hannami TaxID=2717094 RepID=UPI00240F1BCC|nr:DNA translocase FtsK [Vibrio hannami]MDG3087658.1 DNA translocase FtsK 4TM domain-containing protein [Vibrio hannami]